ncbi:FAD-dependent oxidoreductase [uncultured Paracoccus sp.]|uniref:FAD-dependent oxidoreductase n=1 Tax=uncultured Paracoccus sp. TaxID=189685 RepID=UPI0030DC4349
MSGAPILLLGAGHANLLALPPLRAALPDAAVLLVDMAEHATYSGMYPGLIAGHYHTDQLSIGLADFAARHGAGFLRARITGIDPVARQVTAVQPCGTAQRLDYAQAALDVGSHGVMPEIEGFRDHARAVKPLRADLPLPDRGLPSVVIGGGVAGAEIALALSHRQRAPVTLVEAAPRIAAALTPRARTLLRRALDRAGVAILMEARVHRVAADHVVLADGRRIDSALTLGIAGARAPDWLARDLPVDEAGFVCVGPCLQVPGHPDLFAAGDCAFMTHAPRPKAGVFAVRQAPVLAANLAARHLGRPCRAFRPQRDYLKIISLGGQEALAQWHGIVLQGRWLWRVKDRIDRGFMARLKG